MPLTHNEIAAFEVKASAYYKMDDGRTRGAGGLGIKVLPSGGKMFVFRYTRNEKRAFIQLGSFPTLSLADARDKAKTFSQMIRDGLDPKGELERQAREQEQAKREHEQQGTIEQLFKSYTEQMKKDGKRTHAAVLLALEKETYPHLNPTKHDNDPANFIDDAKFGLVLNPVAAIPKQKAAERVGERFLTWAEARKLLDDMEQPTSLGLTLRTLIRLCFFTGGQRPYELAASRYSALRVLREQQEAVADSPFIFAHATKPNEPMPMASLSQAVDRYRKRTEMAHFIPRDFRRTCKTLMGELGIAKDLRDRLQNHALNDVSSKHYDRYEYLPEKRRALELWERRLLDLAEDTVVSVNFGGRG